MKVHICDLCNEKPPNANIKYKYRARRFSCWGSDVQWERLELCEDCLNRIIKEAKKK